ncbi:aminotransferase class I/II-fold pyridoxal phosphate-dependent enzyme [Weissella cibaria]|uniref:aminotransferase class I/II-fold pyridoxal phosphate-dependent enzyme n=1 Tax=Weissella cibaria TaxID=137591 RepID=UPI000D0ACD13|nr:aminotransferase class I/II-fold pyridoxal phosphate-dependent enzyme [Weissella cibaria]AVO65689.1 aromatic amino acid aminotransferase [Weissella cibaria]MBU7545066.1 aminotransferase class I/II-fold pyridoxal phosphate-dependent enzyme [Weissella cibaria]MCT0958433.1 aminotransferase class I/II-fold pyridoxal phosphate-dependent enzyme [Weissella cibaria]MCV3318437.1 aminotransferase class I/II-fold pyridoxal phosphate-dependent enzyme [Weissella cibaria]UOX37778.1 aminotransferase class
MSLNERLTQIQPNAIRAFDAQISDVADILKLTLGEPDFNVPTHIKQAAIDSILADDSHYAPAAGTQALREAAVQFLADRYNLQYDADSQVIVTLGATEGIYDTITAVVNPGDRVLIPAPNFPLYDPTVVLAGGVPTYVDTSATDFLLTPDQLQGAIDTYGDQLMAVVLNYPSNPTGATYTSEQLSALADVLRGTDITVIADEIYSELVYDGQHTSIAQYLPDQTLVLNGVSKSHAMTGYRIGFVVGPTKLIRAVGLIHQFAVTSASNPAMAGAAEALGTEAGRQDTLAMKAEYAARRDYLVKALRELGFAIPQPAGAFYVFAQIPDGLEQDDVAFSLALAQEGKVAVIPGSAFGIGGAGYIRLSYAASLADLQTAVARIATFITD